MRDARTTTTLIIWSAPELRLRFMISAFFGQLGLHALGVLAHGVLVTSLLAENTSVAAFAARGRACISTALAPCSASKLVVVVVLAAWSCSATIPAAATSLAAKKLVTVQISARDTQRFFFSGDF